MYWTGLVVVVVAPAAATTISPSSIVALETPSHSDRAEQRVGAGRASGFHARIAGAAPALWEATPNESRRWTLLWWRSNESSMPLPQVAKDCDDRRPSEFGWKYVLDTGVAEETAGCCDV